MHTTFRFMHGMHTVGTLASNFVVSMQTTSPHLHIHPIFITLLPAVPNRICIQQGI